MHTLVADEDFLDLLILGKLPWSRSLHCSEILSKASRVLPVLPQENYSNPLFFPLRHNPGKNKLLKFFHFWYAILCIFCNGHKPRHPRTGYLLNDLLHWTMSLPIVIHHHLHHQLHHSVFIPPNANHHSNLGLKLWLAVLMDFAI